jgi:hypothetical protein
MAAIAAAGASAVGFATLSGHSVRALLSGGAERAAVWGSSKTEAELPQALIDTAGPSVNLEYPSASDWSFLDGVLREGTPEAARSAARILVEMARLPGVAILLAASGRGGEDAALFCLSALEVLRTQQRTEAIVAIWTALDSDDLRLNAACRAEIEDRGQLIGADKARHVRSLWQHPDASIRLRVVEVLGHDAATHGDVLRALVDSDPDQAVRSRAKARLSR